MQSADRNVLCKIALATCACLTLGGCADTLTRSDFLTAHTGDAVSANKAIHIVDPWPRESFDTRLPGDGARIAGTVSRYRNVEPAAAGARAPQSGGTQ